MDIINKIVKIKVALGRGYMWYAVAGIPFLVARDIQSLLQESFQIQVPLLYVALLALIPLAIISTIDYFFIMRKENALFLTQNDEWNKKKTPRTLRTTK